MPSKRNLRGARITTSSDLDASMSIGKATTTDESTEMPVPRHTVKIKQEKEDGDDDDNIDDYSELKRQRMASLDLLPRHIDNQSANPFMCGSVEQDNKKYAAQSATQINRSKKDNNKMSVDINCRRDRRHHQYRPSHNCIRKNNRNGNDKGVTSQPCLILRSSRLPDFRFVTFKFEGQRVRTVKMEIPIC